MLFDRTPYTPGMREVIKLSRAEAGRLGHDYVGPEHYLLGIIRKGDGLAVQALDNLEIDLEELRSEIESRIKATPAADQGLYADTKESRRLISETQSIAKEMGHRWIGTEHLLIGLMQSEGTIPFLALQKFGLEYDWVLAEVERVITGDDEASAYLIPAVRNGPAPGSSTGELVGVWNTAREQAFESGALQVDSGHLLQAFLTDQESLAGRVLRQLGVSPEDLRKLIDKERESS